jgi:hypothetical protein
VSVSQASYPWSTISVPLEGGIKQGKADSTCPANAHSITRSAARTDTPISAVQSSVTSWQPVRSWSRAGGLYGFRTCHCPEPQQFSAAVRRFRSLNEYGFALQGVLCRRYALVERPSGMFQIRSRHRGCPLFEDVCQSAGNPVFEDSDTSQRLGVTELPIAPEFWFLRQWEMALKAEDDALKRVLAGLNSGHNILGFPEPLLDVRGCLVAAYMYMRIITHIIAFCNNFLGGGRGKEVNELTENADSARLPSRGAGNALAANSCFIFGL